ncbi:hypothetical protein FSP39_007472, partial [Pinctada imbricata]
FSKHGYSGANYDKWVERTETSTIHKMKETFWTTKQAVIQKLGKKEDEHVVASDHELDSKLEVFRAIQKSSMELLRCIEKYQDRLCALSQEENATGRFLKSQSNIDKTRAGKMMAAVGKSQSFAAQQRLALRVPLVRLYQEVETFRYRAISDTLMTINRMEGARTEYRGALLWMKNISEELDPDTYKQLEKFRKVQAQVRKTKAKFDKLKLDVMQKVDLLAASRCNMFSHVLANYQSTLLHFWEKTSRTMSAVAESFKGYQYYEFNIIKELAEPSKKLAEDTSRSQPAERDTDSEEFDPSKLIAFDEGEEENNSEKNSSLQNLYTGDKDGPTDLLSDELNLEAEDSDKDDMTILNEILNAPSTGEDDFSKEWQAVFGHTPLSTGTTYTPVESDQQQSAEFMPSNLLDLSKEMADMSLGKGKQAEEYSNNSGQKDMSAWFSLFADLDPLSNPDAIGKTQEDMTDA